MYVVGMDEIKGCLIMLVILVVCWAPIVAIIWILAWLS
jgi:hypothetical protein